MTASMFRTISRLPGMSLLPGVWIRPYHGEDDLPAISTVIRAANGADRVSSALSIEELRASLIDHGDFDAHEDVFLAGVQDTVIAGGRVDVAREMSGNRLYSAQIYVHPTWRRCGIGRALLLQAEQRLREKAAGHASDGSRFFAASAAETALGSTALLARTGYAHVYDLCDMTRSTNSDDLFAPLPVSVEIRPVRPRHHRAIWEAEQAAFAHYSGFVGGDDAEFHRWLDDPISDTALWQVAWHGDRVVGVARSLIREYENDVFARRRGSIIALSIDVEWRGSGLSHALIKLMLDRLEAAGMHEALITVDSRNPTGALKLYEQCGFRTIRRHAQYRKPLI